MSDQVEARSEARSRHVQDWSEAGRPRATPGLLGLTASSCRTDVLGPRPRHRLRLSPNTKIDTSYLGLVAWWEGLRPNLVLGLSRARGETRS